MIGARGDGWKNDDAQIRALATKLETLLVAEHQATAVSAMVLVIAGVLLRNSRDAPDDVMEGVGAVADQLVTDINILRAI